MRHDKLNSCTMWINWGRRDFFLCSCVHRVSSYSIHGEVNSYPAAEACPDSQSPVLSHFFPSKLKFGRGQKACAAVRRGLPLLKLVSRELPLLLGMNHEVSRNKRRCGLYNASIESFNWPTRLLECTSAGSQVTGPMLELPRRAGINIRTPLSCVLELPTLLYQKCSKRPKVNSFKFRDRIFILHGNNNLTNLISILL
jgi:hypothetical protein